jgi:hypothetical protein
MKSWKFLITLLALVCFIAVEGQAQIPLDPNATYITNYKTISGSAAKSYANSQTDTIPSAAIAGTGVKVAGATFIELLSAYNDSVNVITNIQYRTDANGTWTIIKRDTLNETSGGVTTHTAVAPKKSEVVLRSTTVDLVSGLTGEIRVIKVFGGAVNGVTSATYIDKIIWKP